MSFSSKNEHLVIYAKCSKVMNKAHILYCMYTIQCIVKQLHSVRFHIHPAFIIGLHIQTLFILLVRNKLHTTNLNNHV